MTAHWTCWKCGATVDEAARPLSRLAQCHQCGVDLHVCRMCHSYNPRISRRCDNDQAEPARDVSTANFCDFLEVQANVYRQGKATQNEEAAAKFAGLFGDAPANQKMSDDPMERLKSLLKEK